MVRNLSRSRKRYIGVEVESDEDVDGQSLYDSVLNSILQLFGEVGASKAELVLINHDSNTHQAILRCAHGSLDLVRASIVAIKKLAETEGTVHIISVSGTLKCLRKRLR